MSSSSLWDVRPRYTPGSPAGLDMAMAVRVLGQEEDAYRMALTGAVGAREQRVAEVYGLHGIVVIRDDDGRMANDQGARYTYRDSAMLRTQDVTVADLLTKATIGYLSAADKRAGWQDDALRAGRALLAAGVTGQVDLDRCEDVALRLRQHGAFGPFTWLATALRWGRRP